MQIWISKKKRPHIAQKSVLGGSWASFGRGLGRSWVFLGALGRLLVVFRRSKSSFFLKHGPKIRSKRPSGSILGRYGEGFGRILGGFGKVWVMISQDFTWKKYPFPVASGNVGYNLALLQQCL